MRCQARNKLTPLIEWNTPNAPILAPIDWVLWGCYPHLGSPCCQTPCPTVLSMDVHFFGLNRSADQSPSLKHVQTEPLFSPRIRHWYPPSPNSQSTGFFSECQGEGFCGLLPQVQRFTQRMIRLSCSHHQMHNEPAACFISSPLNMF